MCCSQRKILFVISAHKHPVKRQQCYVLLLVCFIILSFFKKNLNINTEQPSLYVTERPRLPQIKRIFREDFCRFSLTTLLFTLYQQANWQLVNGSSEATNKYTVHKLVQNRCSNMLRSYDLITAYKSFYSLPFIHFLTLVRVQVMEEKCKQRCLDLPLQRQLRNIISPGWSRSARSAQGSPPGWRSLKHPRWFPLALETQQRYCELYQNHWAPNPFFSTWKERVPLWLQTWRS